MTMRRWTAVLTAAVMIASGNGLPAQQQEAAAAAPPPAPARRAPLAPTKAPAQPKSTKPVDPKLRKAKTSLAQRSLSTPRALASDTAAAAAGLTGIGVSPDLNCSAFMDGYPSHPGVFYGDTACATVLVVDGVIYRPALIPAGSGPGEAWTPVSQTVTGTGVFLDPRVITTVVAAGATGVTLTETDTFVGDSLEWTTSVRVDVPAGVTVSRLTRGQDCYIAASDVGIGQAEPSRAVSYCQGRTAALGLQPLSPAATWFESYYGTVWNAVWDGQDLPNSYEPAEVDNGQAVSWAMPAGAGTFTRSWRTFVVPRPTADEQGRAPNAAMHSTTCDSSRPVNCATGDFWHTFTDVAIPARGLPLGLRRTYDLATATGDGRFGYGWHDSLDLAVTVSGSEATVRQETGAEVVFRSDGSGWTADTRVRARLTDEPGGGWRFRRTDDAYSFVFAPSGRLSSVVTGAGEVMSLAYDGGGHLQTVSHGGAVRMTFTWSGDRIATVSDPAGRTTAYTYSASGDLATSTVPGGAVWRFGYDGAHHLLSMTDPLGRATTNTLDAQLRVVRQVQPDGRAMTWEYEGDPATPEGSVTTMTDTRGSVTRYTYSAMLQLSRTVAVGTSAQATVSFDYDLLTLGLVSSTDPIGRTTRSSYDILGRLTSMTDPAGQTTTYGYDGTSSRRTSTVLPSGRTTTATYDSSGRVTSSHDAGGTETTYGYGDPSHPGDVTSTLTAGRTRQFEHDALGNVVRDTAGGIVVSEQVADASGLPRCEVGGVAYAAGTRCPSGPGHVAGTTTYSYDGVGRQTGVTDPLGHTSTTEYDLAGHRTAVTDAAGVRTTFGYDGVDRLTVMTQAAGTAKARTTRTSYDVLAGQGGCPADVPGASTCLITTDGGRRTTVQVDDAAGATVGFVRPGGARTLYNRDAAGQVTDSQDAAGRVTSFSYDPAGRVLGVGFSDGTTPFVSYSYDLDGRRAELQDGTGSTVYEYDDAGRLAAQTTPAGTVRATYNALGERISLVYPDGSAVTRAYDAAGRMASTTDWAGRTTTFTHDEDGRTLTTGYPNGRTVASEYDATGALTRQSTTGVSLAWTRDALGRVTRDTAQGVPTDISYDVLGQVSGYGATPVVADSSGSPSTLGTAQQSFTAGLGIASRTDGPRTTGYATATTGERSTATGGNGATTLYDYDQAGRLVSFASLDGPDVTQLSASNGSSAGGQTITITGSGFAPGATVRFGATASSKVVVSSATSLTALVPAGSGAVDVRVSTPVGTSAVVPAARWTYLKPTVTSLSPASGSVSGGQTVLVNGWNFSGTTAVRFGTRSASFTVVSSQQLRAVTPSGTAGAANVTVTTAQGTSAAARYTYVAAPVVSSVSPGVTSTRGGSTITVTGINFTGATLVRFASVKARSFHVVSATKLTAVAPAGSGAPHLTVTTARGTSAATAADVVRYAGGPGVLRVTPSSVRSTGGIRVTVAGFGFTTSSVLLVNNRSISRTYQSSSSLAATVPAGTGVVHVQVRNGTTTSPAWDGDRLTYLAPAVTKLSTATGPLSGGQRITVTGSRLTSASAVRFGSKAGTGVVVSSSTSLSVVVPAGVAGTVDVRVTTPEGTSPAVTADRWTYTAAPLVTGINRRVLAAQGGQTVTVTGTNLASVTELVVGTTHVPVDVSTTTSASAVAPAGTGTVGVRAVSPSGTSAALTATYTSVDERYQYNGDGLRVSVTSAGGATKSVVWDPFASVPRPLVDGGRRLVYGADGLPLEQVESNGTVSYFVHDHLGSTRALLGSSGEVSATFSYGPFGKLASHTGTASTALLFAAGYQDPTGLLYLVNRYLDPSTGIFLSVDPALSSTGQPYSYASGDPVNATDPLGLWPTIVIGAVMGGVVGTVGGLVKYAASDDHSLESLGRNVGGGLVGGLITGGCMGAGFGLVASAACGAVGGMAEDFINRGRVDGDTAVAGLLGAVTGVPGVSKQMANWMRFTNRENGGLLLSNLWNPGPLARRMWASTIDDGQKSLMLGLLWDQRPSDDWMAGMLRCGSGAGGGGGAGGW